uniref:G_PROTEIN_RECEP_F1_2 domain-containing protein n=1 Tax=Haemonchus contortus TaxID=6289 RepID=A0A7I4YV08_HAECO
MEELGQCFCILLNGFQPEQPLLLEAEDLMVFSLYFVNVSVLATNMIFGCFQRAGNPPGSVASVPASKQGKASTVERKSAEGLSKERNIAARENSKQKGRKQKAQSGSNESVKSGEQKRKNQKKPDKPQDGAHPNSAEGGTIEETDGLYEDVELNRGTESVFIPSYK